MANKVLQEFLVNEDGAAVYLAHITGADGANVNRATFNTGSPAGTIHRYVTNKKTRAKTADGTTLVINDVVFDSLQGSGSVQWPYVTGYNFRDVIPPSAFPDGGVTYEVQYKFTPAANGYAFWSKPVDAPSVKNAAS
jgi:hypothetical protein